MPRYFFNVHDGRSSLDTEGTELLDWQIARREAICHAGKILKYEAERFPSGEERRMEVADASGLIIFRLDFCYTEAAAVKALASV